MPVELGAVLTPMVTPFDARGRVDEEATVRLMHHLLEHGSDGLVLCGTTGEASTLTDEEQLRVIELGVREARPAHPGATIIGGAGSNDTRHAVHLTERITELGVDAILSVTPYYNRPSRRGIIRHYEEIDRASGVPIVLYNIPQRTGLDLPNDLLAELAQLDHVVGVKQSNDDNLAKIDGLQIYAGNDDIVRRRARHGGARRDPRGRAPVRRGPAPDGRRARAPATRLTRACRTCTATSWSRRSRAPRRRR